MRNVIRFWNPRAQILGGFIIGLLAIPASSQVSWQTTHTTNNTKNTGSCTLDAASLRIKAFPGYLDVEEEVTLRTGGTVSATNDANTLEILATFTLPAGSAVTGALLWDGDRLLQAKLLDKFKADSIYEDFVDRDSVPPPRPIDPLILERTAANTYRVRVYPVALNAARRFRIRYQLPPRITADGFEMRVQSAIASQFSPTTNTITTTIEGAGGVSRIAYVEGGVRREMTLPRSLFVPRSALNASSAASATASTRILPVDTLRQVQVKTSFGAGSFAGHYQNIYGSISEDMLRAMNQRIEVVVLWKWHNIGEWKNTSSYRTDAQNQAAALLNLYGQLGGPGNRVGLLHDNSYDALKMFPVGSKREASYKQALDYLTSLQGTYVQDFINNINFSGGIPNPGVATSKARFVDNIKVVKTLYSPDQGVVRHLILVSAGPENTNSGSELNAVFDSVFQDKPVSLGPMKNRTYYQAGFDFLAARQFRSIPAPTTSLTNADIPGFPSMSIVATVRNTAKAYDLNVICTGGASIACGTLEFHAKSANPWKDTVEWGAYHSGGSLKGSMKSVPTVFTANQDTATAILWAASSTPFSESYESVFGPRYGFVDQWASLLALERDSTSQQTKAVYADTGVPLAGPIPDYLGPTSGSSGSGAISVLGASPNIAATWRIQRGADGFWRVLVPGLAAGLTVEVSLHDLAGRRLESRSVVSGSGELRWKPLVARSGTYLLRLKGPGIEGSRLIAF